MSKHPFTPPIPKVSPPNSDSWNLTPEEREEIRNSDYFREQIARQKEMHLKLKRKRISDWWWNRGLLIVNTLLALIAAITGIIALTK